MNDSCIAEEHAKYNGCYECCNKCNYATHICHYCGEDLTHNSYEVGDNTKRHWLSDCRPDLLPHEKGETCTWAYKDQCYGNHETNTFTFQTDGPMT